MVGFEPSVGREITLSATMPVLGECMCLFIIVGEFMGVFWYALVTSVDLTEGYIHGCGSACEWCYE